MKKITLLSLFTGLFLLTSCSNPLDRKYSEETVKEDMKELVESGKVDSTDIKFIGTYMVRSVMLGEELEGKTYGEMLENAQNLRKKQEAQEAEEKALAEKIIREELEKREQFSKVVIVALYDKGYTEYDYQDYLTYGIAYENKSDKDIRAIKGSIQINDLFDDKIKAINITEDEGIPSGETLRMTYTTDYNQFRDEDTRLRSKDLKDLKVVWTPIKIIFADGTTLE
jgi:hypothetical protein